MESISRISRRGQHAGQMKAKADKEGEALQVTRQKVYKNGGTSLARITLDQLAALLHSGGAHVAQIRELRDNLAWYRGRGIDFTGNKTVERIHPQALITQRGGNWILSGYEGIVMLKLENVFGDEAAREVKRAAALLPMTLMAFTGASGMSAYILVRVRQADGLDNATTDLAQAEAFHQAAYAQAAAIYDCILPYPINREVGRHLTDSFMLSLDPDVLYLPEAAAMPVAVDIELPKVERKQPDIYVRELLQPVPSVTQYREYYDQRWAMAVQQADAALDAAGRSRGVEEPEDYLPEFTAACFDLRIPLPEARARLQVRMAMDPVKVARYVNDYYAQHDSVGQLDAKSATGMAGLELWLRQNYDFYHNTVNNSIFLRSQHTKGRWRPFDDEALATLTVEAQREGFRINRVHVNDYVHSSFVRKVDPVKTMFKHLANIGWDGRERIEALAASVPTSYEEWPRLFHVWFCAMVNQMRGGNGFDGNALMPLLIGPQGVGKSRFCRALLPPELRWGWMEKVDFSDEKKVMRAMAQFLLINIDEFNQTSKRLQRGSLKNLLQLPDIRLPRNYQATFEVKPRRASFIGTCNPSEVLADSSGSRRYICVKVMPNHRIEVPVDLDYNQLYAQAVYELNERRSNPERFAADDPRGRTYLTPEEEQRLIEHNKQYAMPSYAVELFDTTFEPQPARRERGGEKNEGKTLEMTRPEIINHLEAIAHRHLSDDEKGALSDHLTKLVEEGVLAKYHKKKGMSYHLREFKRFE